MQVKIWDVDFYNKKTGVNYECMKISSYHKQRGDAVVFVTNKIELDMKCDLTYIAKEDESLTVPVKFMKDEKVRKLGDGFKVLRNYIVPPIILSCRPDYFLYPKKATPDKFDNADILQFFDNKGKKLPIIQPHENTMTNKKTLIVDKKFWISCKDELLEVLIALKGFKNITFLEPISIRRMVYDKDIMEAFLDLNFEKDSRLVWRNTCQPERYIEEQILDFLQKFNDKNTTFIGDVKMPLFTGVHKNIQDVEKDLDRALWLMNEFKKRSIEVHFEEEDISNYTGLYRTFQEIYRWNKYGIRQSLLEFACAADCEIRSCTLEDFYSNPQWWDKESFITIIELLKWKGKENLELFTREWGERHIGLSRIDWEKIEKYKQGERLWF